ncbi:MAG: O-antigen ligase family protein [Acidobacteria bacterium]|nr:O-antigen ligase family protein [Acidobacteriota bacterium]
MTVEKSAATAVLCYTSGMKDEREIVFLNIVFGLLFIAMPLSISVTEISIALLLFSLPLAGSKGMRYRVFGSGFPGILFVLLLIVPILSLVNSPDISVSLPWIRRHFFMLLIPLVMVTVPSVSGHWKRFLTLFVGAATLAAAYAVLQVFFGENLSKPFFWKGYYVHSSAFFSQPNTLAEVLAFGFLAAIFLARVSESRRIFKVAAFVSVFLILAGIVSTRTRTPLTAAVLAGSWLAVRFFKRKGFVAVLLIVILGLAANHFDDRLFWRFRQIGSHSRGDRMEIWHYGVSAIESHPVLGIGYGNFREFLKTHTDVSHRYLIRYNHTHCNVLEAFATTGIVGLIIFLFFWGRVAWDMFIAWRHSREPAANAAFLTIFTAYLVFHVEGLTECTLRDAEVALPLYVLIGIFYVLRGATVLKSGSANSAEMSG